MSISVRCNCGKKYSVSDDKAGKRIRCRDCGEIIEVPDDSLVELSEDDEADADEFDETPRPRIGASRSRQPRRQPANSALPLIVAGAVVGGLLVIGVAVIAFRAGGANPVAVNPPAAVPGAAPPGMAPPVAPGNPTAGSQPAMSAPAAGAPWVVLSNFQIGNSAGFETPVSVDYKFARGAPEPGTNYVLRLAAPLGGTLVKYWDIPALLNPSGGSISGSLGPDFRQRERCTASIGKHSGLVGFGGDDQEPISGELGAGTGSSAASPPLTASQTAGAAAVGKLFALANGRTERDIGPSPNFSVEWELQGDPEPTVRYQWVIKSTTASFDVDMTNDLRAGLNVTKRGTLRARAIGGFGVRGPYQMWIEKRNFAAGPRGGGEQVSNVVSVQ